MGWEQWLCVLKTTRHSLCSLVCRALRQTAQVASGMCVQALGVTQREQESRSKGNVA